MYMDLPVAHTNLRATSSSSRRASDSGQTQGQANPDRTGEMTHLSKPEDRNSGGDGGGDRDRDVGTGPGTGSGSGTSRGRLDNEGVASADRSSDGALPTARPDADTHGAQSGLSAGTSASASQCVSALPPPAGSGEDHFVFTVGGREVPLDETVFSAVYRMLKERTPTWTPDRSFWSLSYPVSYRRVRGPRPRQEGTSQSAAYRLGLRLVGRAGGSQTETD